MRIAALHRHPWFCRSLALLLFSVAAVRVVSTYTVFSGTDDEPYHIASGMEWLDRGSFTYETEHPPLATIVMAAGPYLSGLRSHGLKDPTGEGNAILTSGGNYARNLALARMGNLLFLALASLAVFAWGQRWFSEPAAVWAVFLFLSLPPILGHAGLATLDLACAATLITAIYCLMRWMEAPDWWHSFALGAGVAFAILSKLSNVAFIPVALAALFVCRSLTQSFVFRPRLRQIAFAAAVFLITIWAGYGFRRPGLAGELRQVLVHNAGGHDSFLFGRISPTGFWYFFPVVIFFKTPIAFLFLAFAGLATTARNFKEKPWSVLATALIPVALLGFCMTSRINIGLRHVLVIYPFLALVAGDVMARALRNGVPRFVSTTALIVALAVAAESISSHPDYFAWFNVLAGSHPENIVADSDLDWGQDLHRLGLRLKSLGINHVALRYFGSAPLETADLPEYSAVSPTSVTRGYVAVSVRLVTLENARSGSLAWLKAYQPVERIGKSIFLYRVE